MRNIINGEIIPIEKTCAVGGGGGGGCGAAPNETNPKKNN